MPEFTWIRKLTKEERLTRKSYEVSSVGDKRFSAFWAIMPDHRSIEAHYQCDKKLYQPGGTNTSLGKGKPALDGRTTEELWPEYLQLWRIWAQLHIPLMRELYVRASLHDYTLSDCFASTPNNQAHALSVVLNELVRNGK